MKRQRLAFRQDHATQTFFYCSCQTLFSVPSTQSPQLAAILENLPLRLGDEDRGSVFEAARHALTLYRWMVAPDHDQAGAVQHAEAFLARQDASGGPLLQAGLALHAWLDQGEKRAPMRAAIARHVHRNLLSLPLPLTGAAALNGDRPWDRPVWLGGFVDALAAEAEDGLLVLSRLEQGWRQARRHLAGRRRHSRAGAALEVIAGAPLISATTLAARIGMAPKNALALLDSFVAGGIVVEVTHRSARRLFGLVGLAPLREEVLPPRRARQSGRVLVDQHDGMLAGGSASEEEAAFHPVDRWEPDFDDLEAAMAQADQAVKQAQRRLVALDRNPLPNVDSVPPG